MSSKLVKTSHAPHAFISQRMEYLLFRNYFLKNASTSIFISKQINNILLKYLKNVIFSMLFFRQEKLLHSLRSPVWTVITVIQVYVYFSVFYHICNDNYSLLWFLTVYGSVQSSVLEEKEHCWQKAGCDTLKKITPIRIRATP